MVQSEWQFDVANLRCQYFLMRHGRSEANEENLIASSPDVAIDAYGLTPEGASQTVQSVVKNRAELVTVDSIFTSDFLRTRQTAEIVSSELQIDFRIHPGLRERGFGSWNEQSDRHYQDVWARDAIDPSHEDWGVESVHSVAKRMRQCIEDIDQSSELGSRVLIVSHGDPLQILMTLALGHDLCSHRQRTMLQTADVRSLN